MALVNPPQIMEPTSSTGTPTTVPSSTNSVTILAANSNRKGATFWNESTAILYLQIGAVAAPNSFTAKLLPQGYYELPFHYIGVVSGIWSAINGNVLVTECT